MPFKSTAQRAWMFANHPEMAKIWAQDTPDEQGLPDHVAQKRKARMAALKALQA